LFGLQIPDPFESVDLSELSVCAYCTLFVTFLHVA